MAPMDPISDPGDSQQEPNEKSSAANNSGGNGHANLPSDGTLSTLDSHLPSVPTLNWSYGPPPRPEILSAKPNPVELIHAVRRRWALALGLGLLVSVVAAGFVWYILPVKYEAFALLKVSGQRPAVLDAGGSGGEEFDVFKRTQVELILSYAVLNGTLREPSINQLSVAREHSDDQVAWLKGQLVINYPNDAEIMRIAMKGENPGDALKIVDKVVEVYLREIVYHDKQLRLQNEAQLRKAYENQKVDYETQLAALAELQKFYKTSGSEIAQLKKQMATRDLHEFVTLRDKSSMMLSDNAMAMMLLEAREDHPLEATAAQVLVDSKVENDPIIYRITQQVVALTDHLHEMRSVANSPESMPYVRNLQRQILQLEESIDERKAQLRPKIIDVLAAEKNEKREGLYPMRKVDLEQQQKYLAEEHDKWEKKVEDQTSVVQSLESFSEKVAAKQEEIETLRVMKNRLGAQLGEADVERLAPDRITPVDKATIADGQGDAVRKYVSVSFAFIFSFALIVLGVAVVEFQARKVNSVKEVNDGLGIRVIGELPSITGRAFRRVKGGKGQAVLKALIAERIDGTRTALIHTTAIDPPRVVMVTSAEPHEGKTTTSSQLAASLARSGRRTLLIDADIRSPGVHRVFEMPQDPGLCELLRGEVERDAAIHPTRTANLWLMPAGRCDLRGVQALSSSYLGTIIAALSSQFDYVIIDSGPVLKVADPLLVGQHVDAAIVSVLRDTSRVPSVYEAVERLRSVGITVLGSVVNGVKDDTARHGVELLMAETPKKVKAETTTTS